MRLELGNPVRCSDGAAGELADVVIDPATRRVTHLVVQPHDRRDQARLVPIEWARPDSPSDNAIELDCTLAKLDELERIHEAKYLRLGDFPVDDPEWDVGIEEIAVLPSYGGFAPGGIDAGVGPTDYDPHMVAGYDRIPKGEAEIRRGSAVTSSEGDHVGHVDGFILDDEQRISGLVLEHGHLFGRRVIVIPVGSVAKIESDELHLSLTKQEVGRLRAAPDHWRKG
jgi:sporulation protein YlmC with PRC-barrel domain